MSEDKDSLRSHPDPRLANPECLCLLVSVETAVRLSPGDSETGVSTSTFQEYSMTVVMVAVFFSMAETEQYFSSESRTASSTAFFDTWPPTL